MYRLLKNYLIENWAILTGIVAAISGILVFLKNYYHLINLKLENRRLRDGEKAQSLETELKYISYLDEFKVKFSLIAEKAIISFNLNKDHLLDLLGLEFKNHPIFSRIDYNSLPIPLKEKNFLFLTKLDLTLTIEDVNQLVPQNLNINDTWSRLTKLYFSAYRMTFRKNHLELLRKSSYNNAERILTKLTEEFQNYYVILRDLRGIDIEYFHRSKFIVSDSLIEAIDLYHKYENTNDEKLLGQISIKFDMIISLCHKILIQYYPNGKKFTNANSK